MDGWMDRQIDRERERETEREREETSATCPCRSISGFALPSVIHSNQPLFETSATALCDTSGII